MVPYLVNLWPFGNVVVIWYIFPSFVILCQEKSGNPDSVCLIMYVYEILLLVALFTIESCNSLKRPNKVHKQPGLHIG
jgi:hypothetical protein